MSPTDYHMNQLLDVCNAYAQKWKIEFNPNKSNCMSFDDSPLSNINIRMNGQAIPIVKNMIYLGLPIGNQTFKKEFFEKKFAKCERALYSLYNFGCRPYGLNPKTIGFIFKQYCQSIYNYGLETIYLSCKDLDIYSRRQNILIKKTIGLSKFCKTTPLYNVLKIETVQETYHKHKIYYYNQISKIKITDTIFSTLKKIYINEHILKSNTETCLEQLKITGKFIKKDLDCVTFCTKTTKDMIAKIYRCENKGLLDSINTILAEFNKSGLLYNNIKLLNTFLNYKLYLNNDDNDNILLNDNCNFLYCIYLNN